MQMFFIRARTLLAYAGLLALLIVVGIAWRAGWHWERPIQEFDNYIPAVAHTEWPIFYVKTDQKKVALTFDISWGHNTAPKVLEILKQEGVRATFFLSGPWARRHADLVRRIVSDGHEIASHGDRHINLGHRSRAEIAENIQKADADLRAVSGQQPRFFRPPNGDYDDMVIETARSLGYETVIWAIDTLDWKNPGPEYMVRRVLNQVFNGAIILMHASDSSKQIHLALPEIIRELRSRGYELVTVGELLLAGTPGRNDPRR
ncbi:MAG: polysaccharide deacetylase family sporulation protein PdaB [Limnochordales bacterium]|nr:polysaccharide deacetylase family sporulation protein PdaB [Limnochordales bacterium]